MDIHLSDPSLSTRLRRDPNSTLTFASFDPRIAYSMQGPPDLYKLSLNEELCKPKRIVIETFPNGASVWRFVPSARREEGVRDEGGWPRIIDFCGELVQCSQDQWDMYKLDPNYDCVVRNYPNPTVISKHVPSDSGSSPHKLGNKRRVESPPPDEFKLPPNRKQKAELVPHLSSSEEDDDEDEVETMVVDWESKRRATSSGPSHANKLRKDMEQKRAARREKLARVQEKLGRDSFIRDQPLHDLFPQDARPTTLGSPAKRKVSSLFHSLRSTEKEDVAEEIDAPVTTKRFRTVSPKCDMVENRRDWQRMKKQRDDRRVQQLKQKWERDFLEEILEDIPHDLPDQSERQYRANEDRAGEEKEEAEDEEAARLAAIMESRRKLAELEADRPLWEEQARKREACKRAEETARRAKTEEFRRAAEAQMASEQRAKSEKVAREEQLRREQEAIARRERERRKRQQRWSTGPWTTQRALERYKALSDSFDTTKFSPTEPLIFEDVPWPVLMPPGSFAVEDVDWGTVENFFSTVRDHMRSQDYKTFVEKSHRRFHPDRWRSRGLLKSVFDESERQCLEVAANTIAQALTPLWKDLRGS